MKGLTKLFVVIGPVLVLGRYFEDTCELLGVTCKLLGSYLEVGCYKVLR